MATPRIFSIASHQMAASFPVLFIQQDTLLADDDNIPSAAVFYRESRNNALISTARNSGVEKNSIDVDCGSHSGMLLALSGS